jgi:hypothetical protein
MSLRHGKLAASVVAVVVAAVSACSEGSDCPEGMY